MILISLLGMDMYQAIDFSRKLHDPLVKAFGCSDDDLNFYAPSSFLIHNGTEQTSFWIEVRVIASDEYRHCQERVSEILVKALDDVSVHQHIIFSYFDEDSEVIHTDPDYPLYMTDSNTVRAEEHHHNEDEEEEDLEEEPYYGAIISQFDEYIKEHPDATNREIYEVLAGIREEITARNKDSKGEDED